VTALRRNLLHPIGGRPCVEPRTMHSTQAVQCSCLLRERMRACLRSEQKKKKKWTLSALSLSKSVALCGRPR
jgi:hypothetical protein